MLQLRHLDDLDESWTLVVLTEEEPRTSYRRKRCRALRYAFARQDAQGTLIVCDVLGFYKKVTGTKFSGLLPKLPPMSKCYSS